MKNVQARCAANETPHREGRMIHSFFPTNQICLSHVLPETALTFTSMHDVCRQTQGYFSASAAQLDTKQQYLVETPSTSEVVGHEWSHRLTIVGLNDTRKGGDGAGAYLLGEEAKDTNLSKTSVVDLSPKTGGLLLLGHVLRELEGVVKVEGDGVRDAIGTRGEVGEVTGLATGHVVLVVGGGELGPELEEANEGKDLPLGIVRDGVPESRGVGLAGEGSAVHLHGPGELDAVGVDDVSDEGEHGNTAVLDLGMSEEANGGLIGGAPELSLSEVEGIVEANDRVELLGKGLKIGLCKCENE